MQRWIIIHWFELWVLGLLVLNLWFVYVVLKTLRSVNEALIGFLRWMEETRRRLQR
jgi:hypothetical protein